MNQFMGVVLPATTEFVTEYATEALDCANEVAQSNVNFAEAANREIYQELGQLFGHKEPVAFLDALPNLLNAMFRLSAEGSVAAIKNGVQLNRGFAQLTQNRMPDNRLVAAQSGLAFVEQASVRSFELVRSQLYVVKTAFDDFHRHLSDSQASAQAISVAESVAGIQQPREKKAA